jgi:hypothetical protein
MGRRPLFLAIVAAAVAAAAIALVVSLRGEYRAPEVEGARPSDAPVVATAVPAVTVTDAAPAPVDAAPVDDAAVAPPFDAAPATDGTARRAEREALLAKVRDSGNGREGWDDQATDIFTAAIGSTGTIVDSGCFIAGCAATITFPSRAAYQHEIDTLEESQRYRAWTGGKVLTLPELRPDGSEVLAIVLYRPD